MEDTIETVQELIDYLNTIDDKDVSIRLELRDVVKQDVNDVDTFIDPDENRWLKSTVYRPTGTPGYEEHGEVVLYDWEEN